MRDALNDVFTALLDDAYDYGAGLIKWGGDAILLLFDGADHEARAAGRPGRCSGRSTRVGRLRAPGGTVVLRMSVGITSGPIQFFLVGGIHRELLVAGPTATEVVVMEGIADAGEIALSPALAARLDQSVRAPGRQGAILLAQPPDAPRERAPDVGDVSRIDIGECIPVAARAHVLLDRSEPEHRTITAAFIDLVGTDDLLAELGADALAVEFDERLRTIQDAALRYEVPFYETDVGNGSVKVLLTAGAPSGTGQDEERMLRALREVIETPGRIPIRVGVNTGKVFAGDFGPPYRRAYRVFGDAINTAARVMSRAAPGQILATDAVLERSRTIFETTPIEPFAAKGKALPIHASIVGPAGGRPRASPRTARRCSQAREPELRALLEVIESARDGEGWTIELSGRPGLGKSHLIDQLIARSPDLAVFRGRCDQYQSDDAVLPASHRAPGRSSGHRPMPSTSEIEAALRAALDERLPHLVPWLPVLAIPFGLDLPRRRGERTLEERFLRERLAELVDEFLAVMFRDRLALLLFEDCAVHRRGHHRPAARARDDRPAGGRSRLDPLRDAGRPASPFPSAGGDRGASALRALPAAAPDAAERQARRSRHRGRAARTPRRRGGRAPLAAATSSSSSSCSTMRRGITLAREAPGLGRGAHRGRDRPAGAAGSRPDALRLGARARRFDPELLAAAMQDELVARGSDLVASRRAGRAGSGRRLSLSRTGSSAIPPTKGCPTGAGVSFTRGSQRRSRLRAGDRADDEAAMLVAPLRRGAGVGEGLAAMRAGPPSGRGGLRQRRGGRRARACDRLGPAGARARARGARRGLRGTRRRRASALGEFDRAAPPSARRRRLLGRGSPHAADLSLKEALIPMRFGNYPQTLRRLSRGLRELEQVEGRAAAAGRSRLCARYAAVRFRQNRNRESIAWCRTRPA